MWSSSRSAAGRKLRQALGEFPARTPLRAVTTGKLKRDGYTIEKIIFESLPRYYVTANVYVPQRSQPPFPAVVCPVGHWGDGKAFEDYQRLGIYLARRGFLVLIYDAPGQGERLQYYSPVMGRSLIDPGGSTFFVTIEHGSAGAQSLLTPRSFAQRMVWDGVRAIDYLEERGDVDRRRIACTGTSGGGLQTGGPFCRRRADSGFDSRLLWRLRSGYAHNARHGNRRRRPADRTPARSS